jgi:Flp pilus assembly protein TadD
MTSTTPESDDETRDEQETGLAPLPASAVHQHQRIRAHAARLFNEGVAAGRAGQAAMARDLFAAIVHWYPHDLEARSALALACLESGDDLAAQSHWAYVLNRRASDPRALGGMILLRDADRDTVPQADQESVSPTDS